MDYIFSPWRYAYITTADRAPGCIFCDRAPSAEGNRENDERNLILYRGQHCFIIVNAFPYTSGHVMIVPYAHLDRLDLLPAEAATEMMALAQRTETVLRKLYRPDGINLGMNIGKAAGAGVAGHIHMHVLPRWIADANFMSVIAETRVLPESVTVTAARIREALAAEMK
jgi:ATP adenylyltransferase